MKIKFIKHFLEEWEEAEALEDYLQPLLAIFLLIIISGLCLLGIAVVIAIIEFIIRMII